MQATIEEVQQIQDIEAAIASKIPNYSTMYWEIKERSRGKNKKSWRIKGEISHNELTEYGDLETATRERFGDGFYKATLYDSNDRVVKLDKVGIKLPIIFRVGIPDDEDDEQEFLDSLNHVIPEEKINGQYVTKEELRGEFEGLLTQIDLRMHQQNQPSQDQQPEGQNLLAAVMQMSNANVQMMMQQQTSMQKSTNELMAAILGKQEKSSFEDILKIAPVVTPFLEKAFERKEQPADKIMESAFSCVSNSMVTMNQKIADMMLQNGSAEADVQKMNMMCDTAKEIMPSIAGAFSSFMQNKGDKSDKKEEPEKKDETPKSNLPAKTDNSNSSKLEELGKRIATLHNSGKDSDEICIAIEDEYDEKTIRGFVSDKKVAEVAAQFGGSIQEVYEYFKKEYGS